MANATASKEEAKWPLCRRKALELAKELGLDYFDNPAHLDINETLYLLLPKVRLGSGIPPGVTGSPWLPATTPATPEAVVDKLLRHSLMVQMGTVPDTELDDCILSDAALPVHGLLHLYLSTLGIQCQLVAGVMQFSSSKGADGTPYVWLELDGEICDNSYVHLKGPKGIFFNMRHKDLYVNEELGSTERKLFFGPNNASRHTLDLYRHYGRAENVEKYLVACCFRVVCLCPRVKMYDIAMRDFLQRVYGKPVVDLDKKWGGRCWCCSTEGADLKACSVCKFAKYCNARCQKSDWKVHKILHEEIESKFYKQQ